MWGNTINELADSYNATINVCVATVNCAVSLGREGPGNCFTISGLLSVKLCREIVLRGRELLNRVEKGRGIVLQYPVCSVLNCAGNCFTISGLLSVKLCHQFGKRRAGELFYTNRFAQC